MKNLTAFIVSSLLLFGCQESTQKLNQEEEASPFPGLYSLHIMETRDSLGNWSEWRNGMQGYIMYNDKSTMSVHLTTKGYQETDLQFPNFSDTISIEALKHLTKTYTYFATYTVNKEEEYVQHARISHSNPGEWNNVVRRKYIFSGDTLILQPLESETANLRLKWIRIE